MKNKIKNIGFIIGLFSLVFVACEDKIDPIVEKLEFDRVFTPLDLTARIRNMTTVELSWTIREDADSYVVEISEDSLVFGAIIHTVEVAPDEVPVSILLDGETGYSARVKAVSGAGLDDSKWAAVVFKTGAENILLPVDGNDIEATSVIVKWPEGSEVTHFIISPGNVERTITADEKAAGEATISGLTGETDYTVIMKNDTKTRGTVTFTTLIDLGGALAINPGDDLKAILDAADDGAAYVIFPGEYDLGSYAITKSVKLSGYRPNEKPVIFGQLVCGTNVASVELKSLVFRGNADPASVLGQFFNTESGCNLATLAVDDCEISNYGNNIIYNNASGTYGNISLRNSYIHDIPGSGGDGIDFRSGAITSLTVENTTFANGFRTFLRMQVFCAVTFKNCTFYKVSIVDSSNNNGLFRMNKTAGGAFEVRNCLFVETGVENPSSAQAGNFCRQDSYMVESPVYANNNIFTCYNLLAGLYPATSQISATEIDPGFVDAANGDFTVTNQTLIDNNVGDPRW